MLAQNYGQDLRREINVQCGKDSIITVEETIIPGSVHFTHRDTAIIIPHSVIENSVLFTCDGIAGIENFKIHFDVLPYPFHKKITLWDSSQIQIAEGDIFYNPVRTKESNRLIESSGLEYDGALTRGFSLGNNQSLVFDSELNLQLGGKIGDGYEIRAAITDNNLPVQPDGTTRQLQEFDKVYIEILKDQHAILAGDFDALAPAGYFMKYNRKLKGAQYRYAGTPFGQPWNVKGSAAISRGQFSRQTIIPTEGNQGPYPLRGENGELFIIILAGSEKVFIDGLLMQRGENEDYIMDYNQGEITFTRNVLINSRHRITVEFEYAQFNFQKSHNALEAIYHKNKFKSYINFFQENDSKAVTGDLELTQEDLAILQMAGDAGNMFFKSGIRQSEEGFNTNAIFYLEKDTIVEGVLYTDILQWSTSPQPVNLIVSFSEVGYGNGDYIISPDPSPNGRVYQWIAPDVITGQARGNFAPVIPLQAPQQKQMLTVGGELDFGDAGKAFAEIGASRQDLNRYSNLEDHNNNGVALKINMMNTFSVLKTWNLTPFLQYETSGENFRIIDPYRNPEFARDWNLKASAVPGAEHLPTAGIKIGKHERLFGQYRYDGLFRTGIYTGHRHTAQLLIDTSGWRVEGVAGLLSSSDPADRTFFFRPSLHLERRILVKGDWRLGVKFFEDKNEIRDGGADTLKNSSFIHNRYSVFLRNDPVAPTHFHISYHEERPGIARGNEFRISERVKEWDAGGHFQKWENFRMEYLIRQRNVTPVLAGFENASRSLLGRIDIRAELLQKAVKWSAGYEIGNGQEPRTEYKYIKVQKGEGLYTWVDDGDGIEELNEFEEAPFADQGEYLRLSVFNNAFIRTRSLGLQQTINADLKNIFPKSILSKLAAVSTFQVNRKVREDNASPYWNPFYQEYPDTALLAYTNTLRNILYWNRSSTIYDIQLGNIIQTNQLLLTSGFEKRRSNEITLRGRVSLQKKMDFVLNLRTGERSNESQYFSARNYTISHTEAGPEINVILKDKLRLTSLYLYAVQVNVGSTEEFNSHKFTLEGVWRKSNAMDFRLQGSIVRIDYQSAGNTNVDFTLLQGLQNGTNVLWTAQSNTRLNKTLILTLQYNGRKTGEVRTIHTGTAQVRATF